MSSPNLEEIRGMYDKYLQEAHDSRKAKLPYYEIALWDKVLNAVELRMFDDIKFIGLPLYPIFPILENNYLHFANPFRRVGIEIMFKNSPQTLVDRKVALLEAEGWTIYTIKSQSSYHLIEEFFRFKRKRKDVEYEELSFEEQFQFVQKYHRENAQCLLYYLQWTVFSNEDSY